MKKIVILSGKGGTGKTSVAASLIQLANCKAYGDCDVDAPNLHLTRTTTSCAVEQAFYGGEKAFVDIHKCTSCGMCQSYCRFDAISIQNQKAYVDEIACEGCGVCEYVCKQDAISLHQDLAGMQYLYTEPTIFASAKLKMGRGNSGKLVSEVKKSLLEHAKEEELVIIDGSPGIGCPVLASMQGMDLVVLVAEASISGLSDCKRLVQTARNNHIQVVVCINKWDVSFEQTMNLIEYCAMEQIPMVAKIPYDAEFAKAIRNQESILNMQSPCKEAMVELYRNIQYILEDSYENSSIM